MNNEPLVSVIVPTKNSEKTLETCLESVKNQTYKNIETIVVDNNSIDKTKKIAKKYTKKIYNKGPERSSQRNFGVQNAKGEYLLFIDSDMELTPKVVEECVKTFQLGKKAGGVIIPERSVGNGFWIKVRDFERSFYANTEVESARLFRKAMVEKVGGYDEDIIFYEESTLPQKIEMVGYNVKLRVDSYILHHEYNFNLMDWLKKKYYYAKTADIYLKEYKNASKQINVFHRYFLFFKNKNWKRFLSKPLLALGVLALKTSEHLAAGLGYLSVKLRR